MQTSNNVEQSAYDKARAKVHEVKCFYTHLAIYMLFVPFFIFLNFRSGGFPWAIFPIAGWGLGILGHASEVFGWNPFFGKEWEGRKTREFLEKDDFSSF